MRILYTFIVITIIFAGIFAGFYTSTNLQLPDINNLGTPVASTRILDCKEKPVLVLHAVENRLPVKITSLPAYLPEAVVAVEDERFYSHFGIDIFGVIRALTRDLLSQSIEEGASTITQQLARNALLSHEQTFIRKIREIILAIKIEHLYSKNEILQMYLNQVYFGRGAYGVQAAAMEYFGKNASDLSLQESAFLAGLPQRPNYYSDRRNNKTALSRMRVVLQKMHECGYIDNQQLAFASKTLPAFTKNTTDDSESYLSEYYSELLSERYGSAAVYRDGLTVYATIDKEFQTAAEKALKSIPITHRDKNNLPQPQTVLICIENGSSQIRAMVGGRGTDLFNRAILSKRQPGSAIKPFVYYTALNSGMTPESLVIDQPISFAGYSPENYDNKYHGRISLKTALTNSYNTIAVQLAHEFGVKKIQDNIKACGINTLVTEGPSNDNNLAIALGGLTEGVIPIELAAAYTVIANYGIYTAPYSIVKVCDRSDQLLYEHKRSSHQVLDKQACILLVEMMQDVVKYGTGTGSAIGRPSAGKTGTTSDHKDAWFVGFTPEYTTLVWMGNDDNESLGKITGGDYPATVWRLFMTEITKKQKITNFLPASQNK